MNLEYCQDLHCLLVSTLDLGFTETKNFTGAKIQVILEFFHGIFLERLRMKGGASEGAAREGDPLNTTVSNFDQDNIAVKENIFIGVFSGLDWCLKILVPRALTS